MIRRLQERERLKGEKNESEVGKNSSGGFTKTCFSTPFFITFLYPAERSGIFFFLCFCCTLFLPSPDLCFALQKAGVGVDIPQQGTDHVYFADP